MTPTEFIEQAKALLAGAGMFGATIDAPTKNVIEAVLKVIEEKDEKPIGLSRAKQGQGYLLHFKTEDVAIIYDYNFDRPIEYQFEKLT